MNDRDRLVGYVELWWSAIGSFTELLDSLAPAQWSLPTDLPGWDVHAIAAHIAHVESVLSGAGEETADVGSPAHARGLFGQYTEIGVANRSATAPGELIAEIRDRAGHRYRALRENPPADASAAAPITPANLPWSWERLLRNRLLDVWMHEQDIRRAIGAPGGMGNAAAQHVADYLTEGFGYVVGKLVAAPPGTSAVLAVSGSPTVAVEVDANGRAQRLADLPATPTVRLTMDRETYVLLSGGRRPAPASSVQLDGDTALGMLIRDRLAVTL